MAVDLWDGLSPLGSLSGSYRMAAASGPSAGGRFEMSSLVFKQANGHYTCGGNLGVNETAPSELLVLRGSSASDGSAPIGVRIHDNQTNIAVSGAEWGKIDFYSADGSITGAGVKASIRAFNFSGNGGDGGIKFLVSNSALLDRGLWLRGGGVLHPLTDNAQDLGHASFRFAVVRAGTGAIATSDAREKQWRGPMTAPELAAARRIEAELGFFKWLSAIEEKGEENARLHFGVRAQAVWAIMADEGLVDPLDEDGRPGATPYAFLCWDEWADVFSPILVPLEIPAVLDEDGNEVEPARIDQIPTGEMRLTMPAGNRFGMRYDQLILFLLAAQGQRLAALEAALS